MFDFILKSGTVFDGSGTDSFVADVAIKDGMIAEIAPALPEDSAVDVIDVNGLCVAPGFVDMHTHSDFTLIADGRAQSQVHQGVTTEAIGQCGISCAPVCSHASIRDVAPWYTDKAKHPNWLSFGEYLEALDESTLGVNVVAFVGHGTIHRAVLGGELRAGEPDEIEQMAQLVDQCMQEGASGISTGLEYFPGSLAGPEHLVPIVAVAKKHGLLYATHVRNRDTHYDLGFAEAISTARQAGVRLQISHIQPKFGAPDYAMEHTLEMIEAARRQGVDIAFDVIPHEWNHTFMVAILPKWAQAGGRDAVLARLADPHARARIKADPQPMWLIVKARRWHEVLLINAKVNADLVGMDFAEIGRMRGVDPFDAVLDILMEEIDYMTSCLWSSKRFKNKDVELALLQPECAVISDTVAAANDGIMSDQLGSLSGYGWAARFLQHYVGERGVLPLSAGIAKLTSIPARRLGLKKRGQLKRGFHADVCVFDSGKIASNATPQNPRSYASGVVHVSVNGKLSVRDGRRTDVNAGRIIKSYD